MAPVRSLVVWCPDWPVVAASLVEGVASDAPVAVVFANRVLACSHQARVDGVRRGLRRRDAQGRCPSLIVVEHDPARDARAFEPVAAAVEALAPGVEIVRPGVCAVAARGPVRYFGGEEAAAELLVDRVAESAGVECQVGVADGVFAATLAARAGRIIPPGGTSGFLAALDVDVLDRPELVDLLRRLGIRTLGDFAALPAADVLTRFGFDAGYLHALAAGADERPLAPRSVPPELAVAAELDPPVERVDAAAFAARTLAERLHERLAGYGLACTRVAIEARTEHGEELVRVWRHDGVLTAAAVADRLRWQLDGWLSGTVRDAVAERPTAGITWLRLAPDGVVEHAGFQLGLWGEAGEERDRAHRAMTRVQGMLGPGAVVTAVLDGGRGPVERVRLTTWGDEVGPVDDRPWPGRLPAPAPATVYPEPRAATVSDVTGAPVDVTARHLVTAPPVRVVIDGDPPIDVVAWAGPWPAEERWWVGAVDPATRPAVDSAARGLRRRVRFQVELADGRALLLVLERGRWAVEAEYD